MLKRSGILTLILGTTLILSAGVPGIPLLKIFHKASSNDPTRNILLSPWGIQECFGMISCGADRESAAELSLYLGLTPETSLEICNARKSLQKSKSVFSSYNAGFLNSKYQVNQNFVNQVSRLYGGDLFYADYSHIDACARFMNKIIKQESRGKFDNVFTKQMLANKPVILLLNVLYFNGLWDEAFDKNATDKETFFIQSPEKRKIIVDMMNDTRSIPYYNDGTVHGIFLDYRDRRFKMLALTTVDRGKTLNAVTELLADKGLFYIFGKSSQLNKTVIKLPKLKLSGEIDLKSLFTSMGMTKIFDSGKRGLTGIVNGEPIFLSGARQLVKLELDEEKTEVAAVTYAVALSSAPDPAPPKYNYFYANRPFVLVLFDSETGAVLLSAAVVDPSGY